MPPAVKAHFVADSGPLADAVEKELRARGIEIGPPSDVLIHAPVRNVVDSTRAAVRISGIRKHIQVGPLGARAGAHVDFWEAEKLVRESGRAYTLFRVAPTFGGPFVEDLIRLSKKRLAAMVPRRRIQPIFAGDVARFLVDAIANPRTDGRRICLGGPEVMTYRQALDLVSRSVRGRRKIHVAPVRGEDDLCDMTDALEILPLSLTRFEDWVSENVKP
jgi:uncharacterized protein YbjT (DUF2867 family)